MKLSSRVKVFLFGSIIGLACAYFILRSAGSWLPNDIVLERLEADFIVTEKANCMLRCYNFGQAELEDLYRNGDVRLGDKEIVDENKREIIYEIEGSNKNGREVLMTFLMQENHSTLTDMTYLDGSTESCDCDGVE